MLELGTGKRWELLIFATPLMVAVAALVPGGAWLLPVVTSMLLVPAFWSAVAGRQWGVAWRVSMGWAALLSASIIALVVLAPERAAATVLNGEPYRAEMFGWIFEGRGAELDWRRFLPEHALHLGAFVVLSLISAGVLGLMLGAVLVSYMSYFVGSYAVASDHLILGSVLAWVPWSVFRVAAFVLLGCLLARPLLVRRFDLGRRELVLAAWAGLGIACDLVLKTCAARGYGEMLARFAGAGL